MQYRCHTVLHPRRLAHVSRLPLLHAYRCRSPVPYQLKEERAPDAAERRPRANCVWHAGPAPLCVEPPCQTLVAHGHRPRLRPSGPCNTSVAVPRATITTHRLDLRAYYPWYGLLHHDDCTSPRTTAHLDCSRSARRHHARLESRLTDITTSTAIVLLSQHE